MKAFHVFAGLLLISVGFVAGRLVAQEDPNAGRLSAAAKATGLPKDIFPDQLARIPMVKGDQLTGRDKKIYDDLLAVDYTKSVGIWGADGILLNVPNLARLDYETNDLLHDWFPNHTEYEIATLVVSRETNCEVVWTQHEPQALKLGVSKEAIDDIKYRKPLGNLGEREATLIQFAREIFEKPLVTSETYARAEKLLGRQGLVIYTSIITFRTGGAQVDKAFNQQLNPNLKPLLPIP